MSDPKDDDGSSNGIEARLLTDILSQVRETGGQVVDISGRLGHVEAECEMSQEHLRSIDRRLEQGSSQMHGYGDTLIAHGKTLEQLQEQFHEQDAATRARRRKCSEQMRQLGSRFDDTGKHVVLMSGEQKGLKLAASVLLGVITLTVAVFGALKLEQCANKPSVAAPAPMPAPIHGRR